LPLFRSHSQALVLTYLLLIESEQTLSALASKTGLSVNSVKREIDLLQRAGLVSSRYEGRNRLVSVSAPEPLRGIMVDLVMHSYGVVEVLAQELGGIAGIKSAFIFGSWAARYLRVPGTVPDDIDVLVIGSPNHTEVYEAGERATARVKKEVNIRVYAPDVWENPPSAFLKSVKEAPLVPIQLGGESR
jgi:DNA-binding transcriptional ArsR family regulator